MRKKVLSVFLIAVCILSFTGCSVAGKYVNTRDKTSYIELDPGSNETKGKGYHHHLYVGSSWVDEGLIKYTSGTLTVRIGRIDYTYTRSQISVNKSAKSITFLNNTYKKTK